MENEGHDREVTQSATGLERRTFLKRAAVVGGATLWAAPTMQSMLTPAFATGTGRCPEGRMVRFKYDVDSNSFDSGNANGGGAAWCLPDGYADADVAVNGAGNVGYFTVGGVSMSITVTISADGKSAQVTVPNGAAIEDLQAKAGASHNGECDDFDYRTGDTAVVALEKKRISFVAGVLCV